MFRSFCDRPIYFSCPLTTPLCTTNALQLPRAAGAILHILGSHSVCTRLSPLWFSPQRVFQPSWSLRPPSSRMYSSVHLEFRPLWHCRMHRVVGHALTMSRFSMQAMALTPCPAHYLITSAVAIPSHGVRMLPSAIRRRGDTRRSLGRCRRLLMGLSRFQPGLHGPRRHPQRSHETNSSSRLFRLSLPRPKSSQPRPFETSQSFRLSRG